MSKSVLVSKVQNISKYTIFWLSVLVIYLFLGALTFDAIEHDHEQDTSRQTQALNISLSSDFSYNVSVKYGINLTTTDLLGLFQDIHGYVQKNKKEKYTSEVDPRDIDKTEGVGKWLYFCFITLTTVGYGDVYPTTTFGKAILLPYALIGIPLMLAVLGMLGSQLMSFQLHVIGKTRIGRNLPGSTKEELYPFLINLLLLFVYALCGAVITSHQENWGFLSSCYYWFVFFSTIGYGDLISYGNAANVVSAIVWNIFRFIGLVFVAAMIVSLFAWVNRAKVPTVESCRCTQDKARAEIEKVNYKKIYT